MAGPSRPAQAHENPLCPEIHQQAKMRQDEGGGQHRTGEEITRGSESSVTDPADVD